MPTRLDLLLQYHRDDPGDPFTRFALATEYLKLGDEAKALEAFESLVREVPGYVGTYYHLGKLYEKLGRKVDAVAAYRRGIDEAGKQSDFHARAELQDALMQAEGIGFDDD